MTLTLAARLPQVMPRDPTDTEHVKILLDEPEKACGYSRDGWIDVENLDRDA